MAEHITLYDGEKDPRTPESHQVESYLSDYVTHWYQIVTDAGQDAIDQAGEFAKLDSRLRAAIGGEIGRELDDTILDVLTSATRVGIRIGYALAKTWPAGPEGLADWPMRAAKFAGLPEDDGDAE